MQEYIEVFKKCYTESTQAEKSRIRSEFCATRDHERRYWIKLLGGKFPGRTKRCGPRSVYDRAFSFHRVAMWRLMLKMCSKRMKAAIPFWRRYYSPESLTDEVRLKLILRLKQLSDSFNLVYVLYMFVLFLRYAIIKHI